MQLNKWKLEIFPWKLHLKVLESPGKIIIENDKTTYQSVMIFNDSKDYLVRIIVNSIKNPEVVITVYSTSNLKKYHEG